ASSRYAGPSGCMSGSRRRRATRTTRPAARAAASGPPGRSLPPSGMGADRRRRAREEASDGDPALTSPGGLDGRPFRAQQWDVTRKRSIVMALALAVAVTPALAAEHGGRAAPREQRTEPPAPPATLPPREALQTLQRP